MHVAALERGMYACQRGAASSATDNVSYLAERSPRRCFVFPQKPSDSELQTLVADVGEAMVKTQALPGINPRSAYQDHNKLLSEAVQALSWVIYTGPSCGEGRGV